MSDLLKPWRPTLSDPFDLEKAGHLMRRAAFSATLRERRRAMRRGVSRTLDELFGSGPGEDVDAAFDLVESLDDVARLRGYRVWRLLSGRQRMRERMSWFWHGHFATSIDKVRDVGMMARQLRLFDDLGLGRFDDLLLAVSRDPAMIRWLDNETNVKGRPNENYAREIFELFALGIGNYTERDIQEAARAFTGWHIRDHRFWLARRRHDTGAKSVFGRRGAFAGEDIVTMAAERPESARFLATKWLRFFVHPEPLPDEVDALAACYREHERHVGDTLRVLLGSELFFSDRARRSRIKDPIDLVVGLARTAGATVSPHRLTAAAAEMGQNPCSPPSVEGWRGERAWVTSATWLLRSNFAAEFFGGRYGAVDRAALVGDGTTAERVQTAVDVLLDGVVSDASRAALERFVDASAGDSADAAALLHAAQTLPEGQLL